MKMQRRNYDINKIEALLNENKSLSEITRELGYNRESLRAYLERNYEIIRVVKVKLIKKIK